MYGNRTRDLECCYRYCCDANKQICTIDVIGKDVEMLNDLNLK